MSYFFAFLVCSLVSLLLWRAAVTISATVTVGLSVVETLDVTNIPFASASDNSITHNALNKSEVVTAASPAGKNAKLVMQGTITLVAGAATLNLAAGPGTQGAASVNFTGNRVRAMLIRGNANNANPIVISFGAANPFTGFGAAFSLSIAPGKTYYIEGDATAVAAGNRTLDLAGVAAQSLDFIAYAGDN